MKKMTSIVLLTFILFGVLLPVWNEAASAESKTTAKVTASILNVRSTPSISGKIVDKLKKNAVVGTLSQSNGWTKVNAPKGTGWVSSQYLQKVSVPASTGKTGYVTATSLNLREKAVTSSQSLLLMKKGSKVTILKESGSWYYVQAAGGKKGWASKSYISTKAPAKPTVYGYVNAKSYITLREKASTSAKAVTKLNRGTKITILKTSGDWHQVKTSAGKTGWVLKSYVSSKAPAAAPAKVTYRYVTTPLNLREKGTTSSKSLMVLKKGEKVKLLAAGTTWSNVQAANGKKGWAGTKYLSTKAPASPAPPAVEVKKGYSTVDSLNVRQNSGTSYKVVTTLKKNEEVQVYSSKDNWLNVKTTKGIKGWVSQSYIRYSLEQPSDGGLDLPVSFPNLKGKKIMIDPGHGGHDPGAIGATYGTYERNITLSTGLILADQLRAAGAVVYMTRSTDVFIELTQRPQLSNQYWVDAFVSIHYNSGPAAGTGIETFYQPSSLNSGLASMIQQGIVNHTGLRNRGIAEKNLQVLRTNQRPSVLAELGFLSNPTEENLIRTSAYQQKASTGIVEGLNQFFK